MNTKLMLELKAQPINDAGEWGIAATLNDLACDGAPPLATARWKCEATDIDAEVNHALQKMGLNPYYWKISNDDQARDLNGYQFAIYSLQFRPLEKTLSIPMTSKEKAKLVREADGQKLIAYIRTRLGLDS